MIDRGNPVLPILNYLKDLKNTESYILSDFIFVGCNSEEAEKIYFTWQDFCANEELHLYLSVFDRKGDLVKRFKNDYGLWVGDF